MLAKLSMPILHACVPRERLFARLDVRTSHPIMWICGPAGAGKSSLVASYVESRRLRAAWIHLDAGDKEPGTFFYFLRELLPAGARERVPVLTPEHALSLPAFCHQFFRAMFAAIPHGSVLVLDNLQDAMCPELGAILKEGLAEVPSTHSLMLLSRDRIPAELSRFVLSRSLEVVDWEDLKLTQEDAVAMAPRLGISDQRARTLRDRSDGWVAGLVLLSADAGSAYRRLDKEALFDYLASEVFDQASPSEQELLLASSLVSDFDAALLAEVTGFVDARQVLDRLYRTQHFVTRTEGEDPAFRLHALFREFLLNRLALEKTETELRSMRAAAADALLRRGRQEEAVEILLASGDGVRAAQVLVMVAGDLMRNGRTSALLAWLMKLPQDLTAQHPWVNYWRGAALLWTHPAEAYKWFLSAHELFVKKADDAGRIVCAMGVVDAIEFSLADFSLKDVWIGEIGQLLKHDKLPIAEAERQRAWCVFLVSALDRCPSHSLIDEAVQVLFAQTDRPLESADMRISILSALLYFGYSSADESVCQRALRACYGSTALHECSASVACGWYLWVGWYFYTRGEWAEAIEQFEQAAIRARDACLSEFELAGQTASAYMRALSGDHRQAKKDVERLSPMLRPDQGNAMRMLKKTEAIVTADAGDRRAAIPLLEDAVRRVDVLGLVDACACARLCLADHSVLIGDTESANTLVKAVRHSVSDGRIRYLDAAIGALEIAARHAAGSEILEDEVFACLELLRCVGKRGAFFAVRHAAAVVCALGLKYQSDSPSLREVIVDGGLKPPHDAPKSWPWHGVVHALGEFSLRINGADVLQGERSARKILELLRCLVAAGVRPEYSPALCDMLWPDADGANAQTSLHTALHRLRRFLSNDDAVRHQNGKVWLDEQLIWSDVRFFETRADRLLASGHSWLDQDWQVAREVLQQYRGILFPGIDDPAIIAARERLQAKFLKVTIRFADALASVANFNESSRVLEHALTIDPANPTLLARASRSLAQAGRHDEAELMAERARGCARRRV